VRACGGGEVQGEINGQNFANEPNKLMMKTGINQWGKRLDEECILEEENKGSLFFQNVGDL